LEVVQTRSALKRALRFATSAIRPLRGRAPIELRLHPQSDDGYEKADRSGPPASTDF